MLPYVNWGFAVTMSTPWPSALTGCVPAKIGCVATGQRTGVCCPRCSSWRWSGKVEAGMWAELWFVSSPCGEKQLGFISRNQPGLGEGVYPLMGWAGPGWAPVLPLLPEFNLPACCSAWGRTSAKSAVAPLGGWSVWWRLLVTVHSSPIFLVVLVTSAIWTCPRQKWWSPWQQLTFRSSEQSSVCSSVHNRYLGTGVAKNWNLSVLDKHNCVALRNVFRLPSPPLFAFLPHIGWENTSCKRNEDGLESSSLPQSPAFVLRTKSPKSLSFGSGSSAGNRMLVWGLRTAWKEKVWQLSVVNC